MAAMKRGANGTHPVTRFLNLQKSVSSRRNYNIAIKQFFAFLDGEPVMRPRIDRTANDEEALAALDAQAVAYLAEVKADERSAADDLVDFIAQLGSDGAAPSTIAGKRAGIGGFFEVNGIEISRLDEKVIRRVLPKPRVVAEEKDITMGILRAITPLMDNHIRAAALMMLSSGARPGEILKLRAKDLDLESSPARVTFPASITKTKVRRISFLTPEAVDAVRAWLPLRPAYIADACKKMVGLVANGYADGKETDDDRLFPFDESTFYRAWNNALKKAGLFERCEVTGRVMIHAHGLRKYFRTYIGAAAGVDVAEKLMGHEGYLSGAYVRLTEADLAAAYEMHCHVLMVARGASGELLRQVADQREAVKALEADNAALREELAAANARQAEINEQTQVALKAYLESPVIMATKHMMKADENGVSHFVTHSPENSVSLTTQKTTKLKRVK